jgi:hypothetical protein
VIIRAAAGVALFMLGTMSGQAQIEPTRSTTPSVEPSRPLELQSQVLDIVRCQYVEATDDGKFCDTPAPS